MANFNVILWRKKINQESAQILPEGRGVLVLIPEMSGVVVPFILKSGYSTIWSCSNMPS